MITWDPIDEATLTTGDVVYLRVQEPITQTSFHILVEVLHVHPKTIEVAPFVDRTCIFLPKDKNLLSRARYSGW